MGILQSDTQPEPCLAGQHHVLVLVLLFRARRFPLALRNVAVQVELVKSKLWKP
jgi:hypothetical protein